MQVSAAPNLAVGVGKYVKKVDIIWFGGGPKRYGIVLCTRFGTPSWLVQINDGEGGRGRLIL